MPGVNRLPETVASSPAFLTLAAVLLLAPALAPLASAQVGASNDVRIVALELDRQPTVNQTALATAVVETEGPGTIDVDFRWADGRGLRDPDAPQGQGHRVTKFVDAAGTYRFNLTFAPPVERRGAQTITATATVQGQSDPQTSNNTARNETFVRFALLNLTFEQPTALDVPPEAKVPLRFYARNDGNAPDAPMASAVADDEWWNATPLGLMPLIPPGGSAVGYLMVTSRTDNASLPLRLNLTITSSVSPEGVATAPAPWLRSNESAYLARRGVAIERHRDDVQVFVNETVNATFTLRNDGALPETFLVRAALPAGTVGWNASVAPAASWPANVSLPLADGNGTIEVALDPGQSRPLRVDVTRLHTANDTPVSVSVVANSTNEPMLQRVLAEEHRAATTFLARPSATDLAVTVAAGGGTLLQGDEHRVTFKVTNAGRVPSRNATLVMELRSASQLASSHFANVSALGGGNATTLSWTFPTDGLLGGYAVRARLLVNGSDVDVDPANDAASVALVVQRPDLRVLAPPEVSVVPGSRLLLGASTGGFAVENAGDAEVIVEARLESAHAWLARQWTVTVPARGVAPLDVDLAVPEQPGTVALDATLRASVAGAPRFSASAHVRFVVADEAPPVIRFAGPATPGRVDQPALLEFDVVDATGVGHAELILLQPGGSRVVLALSPSAEVPGRFVASYTPRVAGEHVLEVRAEDAGTQPRGARLANVTWSVLAPAYAGLRVEGAAEGGVVSRPLVRLLEVENGTTRSVEVDVGNGPVAVAYPYEVELPPVEGPKTLSVRAVSHAGATWTKTWNLTLDLTPPPLQDARAQPLASGRMRVEVNAPDAARVLARFETSSGPVEVPLSRTGGVFGATVAEPAGWTSLAFVAEDAAGNQGSLTLDASKRTPAPAALAVLAALGAALLGRRR